MFILTNRQKIEYAQQEFVTRLEKRCDRQIRVRLGYQGGNIDCVINWSENLGLWFHSRKLEGTFNFERIAISRFWIAFGLSEVASALA